MSLTLSDSDSDYHLDIITQSLTLYLDDVSLYNVIVLYVLTCVVSDAAQSHVTDIQRPIIKHLKKEYLDVAYFDRLGWWGVGGERVDREG